MPKTDPRIDTYIAEAAPFAQPILQHLRMLIHRACPEVEESVKWGHPSFGYHGKILCGLSAFKAHLGFGFWHQKMEGVLAADGIKVAEGAGLLGRITSRDQLPSDAALLGYLKTAMTLLDSDAPTRPERKKKPELPTPPDLTAALKKSARAAAKWKEFSPSMRREYIEWITEAKREETRAQRVKTTIDWVGTGKKRNWKYENC